MSKTSRARLAAAVLYRREVFGLPDSQLGESLNVGINEVHRTRFCRSEIHFNGLPGAGPILDSNFDTNGVGLFHILNSRFDSKCKIVESQLQDGR